MIHEQRISFRNYLKIELTSSGGAVSIYGVTLKIQGQYFIDFTVHQMHTRKGKTALERLKFSIISSTVLFVGGPEIGSCAIKRAFIDEKLCSLY